MYKVFLAEDEIVVREGIRNNIPWEQTSYSLAGEAPDGEMALSMIQEIKPDILITDIRMPFMDGLTLSRIVKETMPWIKIIILSGHDEFEYAKEAISIGVEEYLLKPVSSQDMRKTLDKIVKRIDDEKKKLLSIEDLIESDMFLTRLRYASKKDIDRIIGEYTGTMENNFDEMTAYFIFGEVIMASSKIVEESDGDINEIAPFKLDKKEIRSLISSREIFYEKLKSLLAAVIEYRDSHTDSRYRSVIVKAKEYINKNFASGGGVGSISLYSTASYVGISPNHLSAVFVKETGENFIEYLTKIRLEKAKLLLQNTDMKSSDIAYETGFNDPHYFSHIFKKNVGISPKEYRLTVSRPSFQS
ncbi:MAG: response regulator [Treponema sp.]|nr:response regulator [Treponema sp.]MCL2271772.1 response regulator [Treponema sp.]